VKNVDRRQKDKVNNKRELVGKTKKNEGRTHGNLVAPFWKT
jgi:hypothetical protein